MTLVVMAIVSFIFVVTAIWLLLNRKSHVIGIGEMVTFGKRNHMEYFGDFNPTILLDGISESSRLKISTFLKGTEFRMYNFLHNFRDLEFFKRGQKRRLRHVLFRRESKVEKALFLYSYMNTNRSFKFRVRYYVTLYRNLEFRANSARRTPITWSDLKCQVYENNILIYSPARVPSLKQLEWFENKSSEFYRYILEEYSVPSPGKKTATRELGLNDTKFMQLN